MAYWIHENGETTGPYRAIDVLQKAEPETLVSHGQEWLKLREHPDFSHNGPRPSQPPKGQTSGESKLGSVVQANHDQTAIKGDLQQHHQSPPSSNERVYWIAENGTVTGPFSKVDTISRSKPTTLIRYEDRWVRFDQHPHFQEPNQENNCQFRTENNKLTSTTNASKEAENCWTSSSSSLSFATTTRSQKQKNSNRFKIVGVLVLLTITCMIFFGLLNSKFNRQKIVYSEAINQISFTPGYQLDDSVSQVIDEWHQWADDSLPFLGFVVDGSIGMIDIEKWQQLTRTEQKLSLTAIAIISCECLSPERFDAKIVDSKTHSLLAATSPNGLRALWTDWGYLPETAAAGAPVDFESGMTNSEKIIALKDMLHLNKSFTENSFEIEGVVERVDVIPAPEGSGMPDVRLMLIWGRAYSTKDNDNRDHSFEVSVSRMIVRLPIEIPPEVGSWYKGIHLYDSNFAFAKVSKKMYGTSLPVFYGGIQRKELDRRLELVAALESELSALNKAS